MYSRIAIFCSANNHIDPIFFDRTRELGQYLAESGHTLIYGGCELGLMGCIAKTMYQAGGNIIGVVPTKVEEAGSTCQYSTETVFCNDLTDRKQIMMDRADLFIALPGGLGTLDEIFTVAASQTIGYHQKKVILYNINGFWNTCIQMLDDLQSKGFMRNHYSNQILVANSLDDLIQWINH